MKDEEAAKLYMESKFPPLLRDNSIARFCQQDFLEGIRWKSEQSPWIPMSKGNWPNYYEVVWCYDQVTNRVHEAWLASDGDHLFFTIWKSDIVLSNVTHWMPRIKPPNEK